MNLFLNGNSLPVQINVCDTYLSRLRGLMFTKQLDRNKGIYIVPCNGIHMYFMNYAIDVIFIDKDGKVVKTYCNVKQWKLIPYVKRAYGCIEVSVGVIETYSIQEDMIIEIK